MKNVKLWINANDIKQYVYCSRIPFFNNLIPGVGYATYSMLAGKRFEDSFDSDTMQKFFGDKIAVGYRLIKNLQLKSNNLMLQGKLDYALIGKDKAYPIEIKYSSNPLLYKVQLVAYAMLLEDSFSTKLTFGYFLSPHSDSKTKMKTITITKKDKQQVVSIIDSLRNDIIEGTRPRPTKSAAKCVFCEFKNFCDDVF